MVSPNLKKIIIVCGTTASRKSELALGLAANLGGELVCCDSVQLYKGFRIGTAGPNDEELQKARHHLYGVLDTNDPSDAGRYARMADAVITELTERGVVPIVVGGTGLYFQSLLFGLVDVPKVPDEVRLRLTQELQIHGKKALFERLVAVDPALAEKIEGGSANTHRVLRGLEVFEATGQKLSELQSKHVAQAVRYDAQIIMPSFEPPVLNQRIEDRVDSMISMGLVDEVQGLLEAGASPQSRPMQALGYRQITNYLADQCTLEDAVFDIKRGHKKYAKRQRTWFRKVDSIIKLDGTVDNLLDVALASLNSNS